MIARARAVSALAFGAVVGFIGVFLGASGTVAAIAMLLLALGYYAWLRRVVDLAVTLLGTGMTVLILAGRPLLLSLVDPRGVQVELPTYIAVAVSVMLLGIGGILLGVARTGSQQP